MYNFNLGQRLFQSKLARETSRITALGLIESPWLNESRRRLMQNGMILSNSTHTCKRPLLL